jgi:hypothetical protein
MVGFTKPASPGASPAANPNIPQIPQPQASPGSLAFTAQALKQAVDSLSGFRGSPTDRAVTFNDLISLGLLSSVAAASQTGTSDVGSGTVQEILTEGPGITGGPITVKGSLAVEWNAGEVGALGPHLHITGETLDATGFVTSAVTSITFENGFNASPNPITNTGTVYANWRLPVCQTIGPGLRLAGGVLSTTVVACTLLVTGEVDSLGSPIFVGDPAGQPIVVPLS